MDAETASRKTIASIVGRRFGFPGLAYAVTFASHIISLVFESYGSQGKSVLPERSPVALETSLLLY